MSAYITPRKAILKRLESGPKTVAELVPGVATQTGRKQNTINRTLREMRTDGAVSFVDGRYSASPARPATPASGGSPARSVAASRDDGWEDEGVTLPDGWDEELAPRDLRLIKRGQIDQVSWESIQWLLERGYLGVTRDGQSWLDNEV